MKPLLLRALRDFNRPKITTLDMPIFMRLIQDRYFTSRHHSKVRKQQIRPYSPALVIGSLIFTTSACQFVYHLFSKIVSAFPNIRN